MTVQAANSGAGASTAAFVVNAVTDLAVIGVQLIRNAGTARMVVASKPA